MATANTTGFDDLEQCRYHGARLVVLAQEGQPVVPLPLQAQQLQQVCMMKVVQSIMAAAGWWCSPKKDRPLYSCHCKHANAGATHGHSKHNRFR
jgi:hypothetical protein